MSDTDEVSRISMLLGRVASGEAGALGLVFDAAYPELCALARARLKSAGSDGMESPVLVHEVFLRLVQRGDLQAQHRANFFSYAGRVMRSVIVDSARERLAQRRGGGLPHDPFEGEERLREAGDDREAVLLHDALAELAASEPELLEVVRMRFFGGMSDGEFAQALGVTDRTVRRRWERARAQLLATLES